MVEQQTVASGCSRRRPDPWLWLILFCALLMRASMLAVDPTMRTRGDEGLHYVSGVLTSHYGLGVIGHWAPGYELMLAGLFRIFGPDPLIAKIAQVLLSTLTVFFIHGLGRVAGGRSAGRLAGWIAALDPTLAAYSHYLLSETLFVALLCGAVYVFHGAFHERPSPAAIPRIAVSGVLFGLAALTRSLIVWFFPLWILWELARRGPRAALRVLLCLAMALLTIAPWTWRNAQKYGAFLLVDGTFGRTLYLAYSEVKTPVRYGRDLGYAQGEPEHVRQECPGRELPGATLPPAHELLPLFPPSVSETLLTSEGLLNKIEKARERAVLDLVHRQRCELEGALSYIREHPAWVLEQTLGRFYAFLGPNSFFLRAVHSGQYARAPLTSDSYPLAKWIVVALHVLVLGAALLAFSRSPIPPLLEWSALFAIYLTIVHSLSEAHSRYRLPLMPFAIVAAAAWLTPNKQSALFARRCAVFVLWTGFTALCAHYILSVLP